MLFMSLVNSSYTLCCDENGDIYFTVPLSYCDCFVGITWALFQQKEV